LGAGAAFALVPCGLALFAWPVAPVWDAAAPVCAGWTLVAVVDAGFDAVPVFAVVVEAARLDA
jgi:hypothetical protein